jgi:hypothetical protein
VLQASVMSVNSSKFHSRSCRVWGFKRRGHAINNLTSVSTVMMATSHVIKKRDNKLKRWWPNLRYYNFLGSKARPACNADNLTAISEPIVKIMWDP